ncbi:MAG TPA: hypothetical protein VLQ67_06215 [Arachnia sp.]|nr:hypothetical protein [Arachnia sp.]
MSPRQVDRLTGAWPATLDLSRASRRFDLRVFDHAVGEHLDHDEFAHVVVHDGALFFNGDRVTQAQFGRNFVRFSSKTADRYVSGVLSFTPDALAVTGRVFLGATEGDATAHDVAGVTPPTVYTTRTAISGAVPSGTEQFPTWSPPAPADSDAAGWTEGLHLVVGYAFTEGGQLPVPVIQLVDPKRPADPVDLGDSCALTVDPKTENLILTLVMDDPSLGVDEFGPTFPGGFIVEFDSFGDSFRGVVQRYDADTAQLEPTRLAWSGTAVRSPARPAAALVAASAPPAAAEVAADLNVAELYSLQPDAKKLQDTQFNLLIENMKWALADNPGTKDWVSTYWAEEPPSGFSEERKTLIRSNASFYTDRFAVCYLGSSFDKMTGSGAPATKLNEPQKLNLAFYMQAGLATEKAYNAQSHGVYTQAFVQALPRLRDYIADQNTDDPAHDWAKRLYDQITTPAMINQAVLKVMAGHGMEEANRHSAILLALQPSGDYARQYHTLIVNASLSRCVEHLKFDSDSMKTWLGDSIQAFIDALMSGALRVEGTDPEAQARLIAQAEEMQKAAEEAGGVVALAEALTDLSVAAGGKNFWETLANAETTWGKVGYKFASSVYCLAFVAGISQAVISFMSWDKLTGEQKASVVISTVQIAAKLVGKMPTIIGTVGDAGTWGMNKVQEFYRWCADSEVGMDTDALERSSLTADEDPLEYGTKSISNLINPETEVLEIEGSTWAKTFDQTVGRACEVIGAVAAVAFAFLSEWQFLEDLSSGAPLRTEILDGIIMAANFGVAIFAVVGLFSAASFIPVVGAIFAIIGIVAALIAMFWPPDPKPNPIEVFMKDHLVPAASGAGRWILDAPAGWARDKTVPARNAYNPGPAPATG